MNSIMRRRRALMAQQSIRPLALYYQGVISSEVGDFTKRGFLKGNSTSTFVKNESNIYIRARRETGKQQTTVCIASTYKIDFSKYGKIKIKATKDGNATLPSDAYFCIVISPTVVDATTVDDAFGGSGNYKRSVINDTGTYEKEIVITDAYKGKYYLSLYCDAWTGGKDLSETITEIWLE